MHVGYARTRSEMIARAREEIMQVPIQELTKESQKSIPFRPTSRPVLKSLHLHLLIWDLKLENLNSDDADIYDIAGLQSNLPYTKKEINLLAVDGLKVADLQYENRRAKRLAVQRHFRIASQYIENVAKGKFPYRNSR